MQNSTLQVRPPSEVKKSDSGLTRWLRKYFWGIAFLLPAAVIFILFLWMPIIKGFVYSFYQVDFVKGNTFVGLDNYKAALEDPVLLKAIGNTLYYVGLGLLIGFVVPIFFAIMISELRKFQGFVRVSAYLPNVIPLVVLYSVWRWFYDPVGPINGALTQAGAEQINFLTNPSWSMISLVFMETWQSFGSAMLIYLAAVLSVPRDWYEASEIDGAGVWQRIWHITLPSIRNLIVLMFILQLIAASQGFQSQLAVLDGGPNNTTMTFALLIVKYATTRLNLGVATALGVMMFLVLGLLSLIQYRLNKEDE
ncbi:carbohydrate ABC transporter permease [Paenibacillus pinihumi]|uniref:carbohydrate ABC transporter permease n=1 Tax=Paenibacillus pinihumi TaxID=669462 RepID=UPI00040E6111|nr:sugar ABC transporter permease [Paenibacillus pinihumi]